MDASANLNQLKPLIPQSLIHYPLESESQMGAIPSITNSNPLFINYGINFPKLYDQTAGTKPMIFPVSNPFPIIYLPLIAHL
jgi:hypothetical protein